MMTNLIQKRTQDLRPYERNPRKNDAAVEAVAQSIKEFGFRVPIIIDAAGVIIAGHTRWKAAQKLGLETVPCISADDLTPEQVKAFRLADNKTAELSEWDINLLDEELKAITTIDMTAFGFGSFEDAGEQESAEEDDFEEEEGNRHDVKPGDLWACGEHRIMCGDAQSVQDADILMGGVEANMVFTDPPYGVSIGDRNKAINDVDPGKGGRIEKNIIGDTLKKDDLYRILVQAMTNLRKHAREDASYYVSAPQGGDLGLMMMMMMKDAGLTVRHNLVWVKNVATFSMGRLDYDYRHEPIFYTWTKKHKFYGGYETTVIDDTNDVDKMSKAELKDLVRKLRGEGNDSVIYCDKPHRSDIHPTMKPVKLVSRFLVNSSQKGDVVADFFGGSGTTMIAAEQLGRKAYLMELDPHYADVIITRWEALTGRKAQRIRRAEDDEKENVEIEN